MSKSFLKCLAVNDCEGVNSSNQIPGGGDFQEAWYLVCPVRPWGGVSHTAGQGPH